jgi:hypothetical protein
MGGSSRNQRQVADQRAVIRGKIWAWIFGRGKIWAWIFGAGLALLGFYVKHCIERREQALQEIRSAAVSSKTADDRYFQSAAAFYSQIDVLFRYVEANKPKTKVLAQYRNDLYSLAQRAGIDCEQSRAGHYNLTNALAVFEEKLETVKRHAWHVNFRGNCDKWDDWQQKLRSWDVSSLEKDPQIRSDTIKSWTNEIVKIRKDFEKLNQTAAFMHGKLWEIIDSQSLAQASLPRTCWDCLKSLLPNSLQN